MSFKATHLSCTRQALQLFTDLSLQVEPGEMVLVEGANGSGKSSLLRLLTGLATPDSGDIFWRGQPIQTVATDYRANMHYISHSNGLKLGLTVIENVRLVSCLALNNLSMQASTVFSSLQLDDCLHKQARYLSAGQKRRVALARLWLLPRPLWILDEPLTALDVQTQTFFLSQLESHLQQGGMAIISSHHAFSLPASRVRTLRLRG